jgi:hypothetical protein
MKGHSFGQVDNAIDNGTPFVAVLLPLTSRGTSPYELWMRLGSLARSLHIRGKGCDAEVFVGVDEGDEVFDDQLNEKRLSDLFEHHGCSVARYRRFRSGE